MTEMDNRAGWWSRAACASADRAEDVAADIDMRLADRLPLSPHVFLDPTQMPSPARTAGPSWAR